MDVTLNDAWDYSFATGIDHTRVLGLQPDYILNRPYSEDPVSSNGDGRRVRLGRIHGECAGICDQNVGDGHEGSSF
jgi:hypothetical protein